MLDIRGVPGEKTRMVRVQINAMNRKSTIPVAVFAAVAVGMVASAQIFPSGTLPKPTSPGQFGDLGITQSKVGNFAPSTLVTLIPSAVPEVKTTGLAVATALGFFALSRFIYRKK
jgi:hypothetical protein